MNSNDTPKTENPSRVPRLNLTLSERARQELDALAKKEKRSLQELVRFGLGLVMIHCSEIAQGHRLVVVDKEGKIIKEIVFPA